MGYLIDLGDTLCHDEVKGIAKYVKEHGVLQLIQLLKQYANHKNVGELQWGYEIESHVVTKVDGKYKFFGDFDLKYKKLDEINNKLKHAQVTMEYGAWMIEMIPRKSLNLSTPAPEILDMMKKQLSEVRENVLDEGQHILSLPVYAKLGYGDYFVKPSIKKEVSSAELKGKLLNMVSNSKFLDDVMISWHPRFPTLTKMIRERRGENINIKIPIFNDKNTCMEVTDDEKYPGFIHMDAMGFGMGNSCFQMTYSARDMAHARHLYDMFATIGPLGLALTAGSPFFKGKVSDIDVRWPVVAASVDDRTAEERDPTNIKYIPKSRYDSVSFYISGSKMMKDEYNDLKFPVNQEIIQYAREAAVKEGVEIDSRFLNHIGFLYMRDPLVIYKDKVVLNDKETSAHFENIQSTNWNSVRFKPPSFKAGADCVWRVEYRTPEIGINEKDNLATIAFVNMFLQVISYDKAAANFYIPMTKLEENMQRSFKRNAILKEKFWCRRFVLPEGGEETKDEFIELTLSEFFYGSDDKKYIGFLEIYNRVVEMMIKDDPTQKEKLEKTRTEYLQALELMLKRAKGEVKTTATFLREYVMTHPKYNHDSIIPEEILDEIAKIVLDINEGKSSPTELLG